MSREYGKCDDNDTDCVAPGEVVLLVVVARFTAEAMVENTD